MSRLFPAIVACVVLLGLWSGCSHYRLGTSTPLPFATLYVAPTTLKILLPQAQAITTAQIRAAFLRDSRVTLVNSPGAADAILEVEISDYRRDVATQRRDDTGLARKFTLNLITRCTLKDNRSGKTYYTHREISVANCRRSFKPSPCSPMPWPKRSCTSSSTFGKPAAADTISAAALRL